MKEMLCPNCNKEISAEAVFCGNCGTGLKNVQNKQSNRVMEVPGQYENSDIRKGKEWRSRWDKYLNKIIREAVLKAIIIWLIVLPIICTVIATVYKYDDTAQGVLSFFVVIMLLIISAFIIDNARNKVAREKVILQQAEDTRYMAVYIERICEILVKQNEVDFEQTGGRCDECNSWGPLGGKYCINCGERKR